MEQRKVIQFGKSALCMTLPHAWTKKHQIRKGDLINVQETLRNSLELFPAVAEMKPSSSLTIDISGRTTDEIIQLILATYLNGYTVVTLKGSNKGKVAYLREHIHEFIAAEIMEVTSDTIVIHVFWDVETINLNTILRRIDHIIRSIFEETKDILQEKVRTNDIKEKGNEIQRQVLLGKRAITYALNNSSTALKFNLSSLELYYLSYIIYFSGRIAEYIPFIAESIEAADFEKEITQEEKEEFTEIFTRAYQYYKKVMDVYNKRNQGQKFVLSEYEEFHKEIEAYRQRNGNAKKPIPGEYLMLLVRTIKEMEFTMINLENSPKPLGNEQEQLKQE